MKNKVYIYALLDENNVIRYIGKSINPKQRYSSHISRSKERKTHTNCWIYGLLQRGVKPSMQIIEECTEDNWIEREQYWIKQFDNLTNLTDGGEGLQNYRPSEKTRQLMSLKKQGVNNNFYGKTHSDETKKLLAELNKKNVGDKNAFYGRKHSDETKALIAESGRKRAKLGNLPQLPVMYGSDNPSAKKRTFISPDGKEYIVYNTQQFCRDNNLSYDKVKLYVNKGKIPAPTEPKTIARQRPKSLNIIGWEIIQEA